MHAGLGAAWMWRGEADEGLGADVLDAVQRFVRPFGRSMRALGGARFDSSSTTAPEWRDFGSYCMLIPAIDLVRPLPPCIHMYMYCGTCCSVLCRLQDRPLLRGWEVAMQICDTAS